MNHDAAWGGAPDGLPFPLRDSSEIPRSETPEEPQNPQPAVSKPHLESVDDRIRKLHEQQATAAANAAINDDDIDPSLHASSSAFSMNLTANSTSHKRPAPESDSEDANSTGPSRRGDFRQLVKAIKIRKHFRPHIEAMLDEWVQFKDDPLSHALLEYSATLEVLNNTMLEDGYKIPPGLRMNLRKYTFAVMLSPILTAYRGNVIPAVLNAMRKLNISNIPDPKDEDQINIVSAEIRLLATEVRKIIKSKIVALMDVKQKAHAHISDLTHDIVTAAACGVAMTAPLQVRIAFLRAMIRDPSAAKDYWLAVDLKLRMWEETYDTKEALQRQLLSNLELDQINFPHPATKTVQHPTVTSKDLEYWQITCNKHAGKAGTEKLKRKGKAKAS